MLYCRACAVAFDKAFGRRALTGQHFLDPRGCERCGGDGPTTGVASADVVSGHVSWDEGHASARSGARHFR